jgi:hypothetical protein
MRKDIEIYIANNYYELLGICKKYTSSDMFSKYNSDDWASELLHEVIVQLYDKEHHNVKSDEKSLRYYIVRVIMVNWCYPTSPFYRKHKKIKMSFVQFKGFDMFEEEQQAFETEELYQLLEENYGDLDWFKKSILDMYLSLNSSMKAVSRKTNIPIQSISRYIKDIRSEVKTNIIEKLNS